MSGGAAGGKVISEGLAVVKGFSGKNVFYNPVQEFNRDTSIAVLSVYAAHRAKKLGLQVDFGPEKPANADAPVAAEKRIVPGQKCESGLRIFEGLSASGLRSIRYAKEVPFVRSVTANDLEANAVTCIRDNIQSNGVSSLVTASQGDASLVMGQHRGREQQFDCVDLDPFGTPAPFINDAVQCVKDGGLLLVTATDLGVLCGAHIETAYSKYHSVALKSASMHENALRILLFSLSKQAAIYGRYIKPKLSFFVDFYIRVVVEVHTRPATVKDVVLNHSLVNYCPVCGDFSLTPLAVKSGHKYLHSPVPSSPTCPQCNTVVRVAGPVWNGPLHEPEFVAQLLDHAQTHSHRYGTSKRMAGVLSMIHEELSDTPLFYSTDRLFSAVKCCPPKLTTIASALLNAGYRFSLSHCSSNSVKTDAPPGFVWDLVRQHEKDNPIDRAKIPEAARTILSQPMTHTIDFTPHSQANPPSRESGLSRFQMKPPYWGPGAKPKEISMATAPDASVDDETSLPPSKVAKTDVIMKESDVA